MNPVSLTLQSTQRVNNYWHPNSKESLHNSETLRAKEEDNDDEEKDSYWHP